MEMKLDKMMTQISIWPKDKLKLIKKKGEEKGNDATWKQAISLLDPVLSAQGRAPVRRVTIRTQHITTPPDSTTGPSSQPEDDTSEKVIHESSSTSDSERTESETDTAAPKGLTSKASLLVHSSNQSTRSYTITHLFLESTPFIALLKIGKIGSKKSEVKVDHSADVLALIRSQVPTAVDKYLGTKLDDAFIKCSLSHMNKKKSANKNTTNYRLYHALMEALIADEDAMDKEVADKEPEHDWQCIRHTYKVPEEKQASRKTYDNGSFIKWNVRDELEKELRLHTAIDKKTLDQKDLSNLESFVEDE
ncbi:hypothetical protein Tco_0907156 [Tanacetum coccineum]|uniref:Uncharacterized protein n=1 Tax=Tanacetum coccineum TaxID=301880 RepID=A0ABQ5CLY7_9ASTR